MMLLQTKSSSSIFVTNCIDQVNKCVTLCVGWGDGIIKLQSQSRMFSNPISRSLLSLTYDIMFDTMVGLPMISFIL